MPKRSCHTLLLIFLCVISSSCVHPSLGSPDESSNPQACIPPMTTTSYPVNEYNTHMWPTRPPYPWRAISPIPQSFSPDSLSYSYFDLQFSRDVKNESEIWIMNTWAIKKADTFNHSIYVYRTGDGTWSEVPSILEDTDAEIVHLYQAKDGTVWAAASTEVGHAYGYYAEIQETPYVFAVFDEEKRNFTSIEFPQEVPLGPVDFDGEEFWIFEKDGPIYSLNPHTLEITEYLDPRKSELADFIVLPKNLVKNDGSLAFSKDGSFYFLASTPREYPIEIDVFHFSPKTDSLRIITPGFVGSPSYISGLLVDQFDNLWMSDIGWMDKDGNWYHQLIRSPVFITSYMEGQSFDWEYPEIVLESSNGVLWFSSTNGMVFMNPKDGNWCWFTTYRSEMIEDAQHNLWMTIDGELYKSPLE